MRDQYVVAVGDYTPEDEDRDDLDIAKTLVRDGWKRTSNKFRHIARLPEGLTGLEALLECSPSAFRDVMERAEQQAANTYRRMYASEKTGTAQTLDHSMFEAFKRAGGESSW